MAKRIYQFKIELDGVTPTIWRRIQVPETYSFWDLHVAIQDAMGWLDCHLHAFRVCREHVPKPIEIGIPDEYAVVDDPETYPGWEVSITDLFYEVGSTADYEYDFGDGWRHKIILEGILLREKGQKYPKCIAGARACPPEDCGGIHGYYQVLDVLANPNDEEHESMLEWLGGKYNPREFARGKIKFDNPTIRWKRAFS
jgi:hypothetical protein